MRYDLVVNNLQLAISEDETILQAIQRQGYTMPSSCLNGVCRICQYQLLDGVIQQSYPQRKIVKKCQSDKPMNGFACTSRPRSNIRIVIDELKCSGELAVKKLNCSIQSVEKLNHDVYQVKLQLPATASQSVSYHAGQYLDLFLPNGKSASFSIGSAPEAGRDLELHIRHNPHSELSSALLKHLQNEQQIDVELAKGEAFIDANKLDSQSIVILAAASTGFSQVKSVVEHLLAQGAKNQIHIYWGVRVASDLYWSLLPEQWAAEHAQITYHPVISDPTEACEWTGRIDLLPAAVLQDFEQFSDVTMLASGSPAMVYALLGACESKGMLESQLLSDVLAYAPRPAKA
ncbi:MAG: FAD-binding oxidoreductase [Oceanospirillaceae bacterium]